MSRLLDTHIFIALLDSRFNQLPTEIQHEVEAGSGVLYLSVASLWEIAIKSRIGKLALRILPQDLPDAAKHAGLMLLHINERHALHHVEPEAQTRDPFDRMLLAQCAVEGLKLVTLDMALANHPLSATSHQK